MNIITLLLAVIVTSYMPQDDRETLTQYFKELAGGRWKSEGKWNNGQPFKQEIEFTFSLDGKLVKTQSYGFIDDKTDHWLKK